MDKWIVYSFCIHCSNTKIKLLACVLIIHIQYISIVYIAALF